MIFNFKNLGPITEANIDLKPLTIFIGENNTGKTYAAYSIYSYFRKEISEAYPVKKKFNEFFIVDEKKIEEFLKTKTLDIKFNLIDLVKKHSSYFESMLSSKSFARAIDSGARNSAKNFWRFIGSNDREYFNNFRAKIEIKKREKKIDKNCLYKLKNLILDEPRDINIIGNYLTLVSIRKKKNSEKLDVHLKVVMELERDDNIKEKITERRKIKKEFDRLITFLIFNILIRIIAPWRPYIFPTHRNTLLLDSMRAAINISSREIVYEDKKRGISVRKFPERALYSRPLMDFLEMLDNIEIESKRDEKGPLYQLGEYIEKNLLGGKIVMESAKKEIGTSVKFSIENGKKTLNLVTSSSMVQQLSSIILYLKYIAKPGDLVVLDEPEANLHPAAQLKFVETIALMVNNGIWVLVTTHTPYIVDHINNLITAYIVKQKLNKNRGKSVRLPSEINSECTINPSIVSAYEFKKEGNIVPIIEEQLINWESFGEITDKIDTLRSKLLIAKYENPEREEDNGK